PRHSPWVSAYEADLIENGVLEKMEEIPNAKLAAERSVFSNYRFWILTFCNLAGAVLNFGINTWMPSYLTEVRHLSLSGMGYFTAASWILCPLFMYLCGRWSDRLLRRAPFITSGYVAFAVFFYIATLMHSSASALVMEAVAIWGYEVAVTMTFSLLHSLDIRSRIGRSTGVLTGVSNLISAFVPTLMGAVIAQYHSFTGAFLILSGTAILAALLTAVMIPQRY
ncbi:MAG: MFS transporter, partial [Alicyclobacillus sp.]|nr:MFS transporter [Alicyclobacillus sp.]